MTNEQTQVKPQPYSQVLQWVAEGKEIEVNTGMYQGKTEWSRSTTSEVLYSAKHGVLNKRIFQPEHFRLKPQRHVHQDLIDAFENGDKIQMFIDCEWQDVEPQWSTNRVYRIKPEPKPDVTEILSNTMRQGWVKVSKPTCFNENIKITRCGETHKIKSVEII